MIDYPETNSIETLETLVKSVAVAQAEYATYSQEQVDYIFKMAALAANTARLPLSKQAV